MARDDGKQKPPPPPPPDPASFETVTHGADTEAFTTKVVRPPKEHR